MSFFNIYKTTCRFAHKDNHLAVAEGPRVATQVLQQATKNSKPIQKLPRNQKGQAMFMINASKIDCPVFVIDRVIT